jgi:geranylgeranyl diphosphate synthase, type II
MNSFEQSLNLVFETSEQNGCPPLLAEAMRHAVFPGGARIRPRLTLAVAKACGGTSSAVMFSAAAAIELLHCASLVHDDLPCFDDAATRRGKPSVHAAFGQPLAVLSGDALIVLAFETLGRGCMTAPDRLTPLIRIVGGAVGSQGGIVAGQAWESEPVIDLSRYHQAKTGALFAGATMAGAAAAGCPHEAWRHLGEHLGAAFQVADDIRDVACSGQELGKPVGQDAALHRPNAAHDLGLAGAIHYLDRLITQAVDEIPDCPGAPELRTQIILETQRFLPEGLARSAA